MPNQTVYLFACANTYRHLPVLDDAASGLTIDNYVILYVYSYRSTVEVPQTPRLVLGSLRFRSASGVQNTGRKAVCHDRSSRLGDTGRTLHENGTPTHFPISVGRTHAHILLRTNQHE